jgi:hypothetical protein
MSKATDEASQIEEIISIIESEIFKEKTSPFPAFSLKADWSAIVWPEWHSVSDEADELDGPCFISPQNFELLTEVIHKRTGSSNCWLIDTAAFVDKSGDFLERNYARINLIWSEFNQSHELFKFSPSRFYLVDESLSWLIHVDESVLIAGDDLFIALVLNKLGGLDEVQSKLLEYTDEHATSALKLWIDHIAKRLSQRHESN